MLCNSHAGSCSSAVQVQSKTHVRTSPQASYIEIEEIFTMYASEQERAVGRSGSLLQDVE